MSHDRSDYDPVLEHWEDNLLAWDLGQVDDKVPEGVRAPFIVLDVEMEFVCGCQTQAEAETIARVLSAAIHQNEFRRPDDE